MKDMEYFKQEALAYFTEKGYGGETPIVFGEGPVEQPVLMLIGEAPGEQEALQGRPFVGKAGKNLDAFLQAVGLKREEIYISNVVKIRPSKISAAGRKVNRPPSKEEKALFAPWLMREIALIKPMALVTLGNVALQTFVEDTIGNRHGRWTKTTVQTPEGETLEMPLFALYHPASVIYNRSLKDTYDADLLRLASTLSARTDNESDI